MTLKPDPHGKVERRQTQSQAKGMGLFATGAIKAGTCISSETAVLVLEQSVLERCELSSLVNDQNKHPFLRMVMDELSCEPLDPLTIWYHDRVLRIIKVRGMLRSTVQQHENAHAAATEEFELQRKWLQPARRITADDLGYSKMTDDIAGGLFPTGTRYNHSCAPNAFAHYEIDPEAKTLSERLNPKNSVLKVHALRDIKAGKEVTISWLPGLCHADPYDIRQGVANLAGFDCACDVCESDRRGERVIGDHYRHLITDHSDDIHRSLDRIHRSMATNGKPRPLLTDKLVDCTKKITDVIEWMKHESLLGYELVHMHSQLVFAKVGRWSKEEAAEWVEEGRRIWRCIAGEDSSELQEFESIGPEIGWERPSEAVGAPSEAVAPPSGMAAAPLTPLDTGNGRAARRRRVRCPQGHDMKETLLQMFVSSDHWTEAELAILL